MERSVAPERLALFCGAKDPAACAKAALLCEEEFSRGEYLLRAGEACAKFGAVLAGSVYVVREDERGAPGFKAGAAPFAARRGHSTNGCAPPQPQVEFYRNGK